MARVKQHRIKFLSATQKYINKKHFANPGTTELPCLLNKDEPPPCHACEPYVSTFRSLNLILSKREHRIRMKKSLSLIRCAPPCGIDYLKLCEKYKNGIGWGKE